MRNWVIPCKFDPARPYVFDLVADIQRFHPEDRITVVDSGSDDNSYLDDLDVFSTFTDNHHYATAAWRCQYDEDHADRWCLVHDSMRLHAPVDWDGPLKTLRWFGPIWGSTELTEYGRQVLADCGLAEPPNWQGVLGPVIFIDNSVMEDLDRLGILDARPKNKEQAAAMERVVGIALGYLGYDVTNSFQGNHGGTIDESVMTKIFGDRQ